MSEMIKDVGGRRVVRTFVASDSFPNFSCSLALVLDACGEDHGCDVAEDEEVFFPFAGGF